MKFQTQTTLPKSADALVVRIGKKSLPFKGKLKALDQKLNGLLSRELKAKQFKGKPDDALVIPVTNHRAYQHILAVGYGADPCTLEQSRKASAMAVGVARKHHFTTLVSQFTPSRDIAQAVQGIVEGSILGDYIFDKYKSGKQRKEIKQCLVTSSTTEQRRANEAIRSAQVGAEAQVLARDLANEPPSILTPRELAKRARAIAKTAGLGISVMGPAEIKRAGMGAYLAVSKGSDQLPQFIKLTYRPKKPTRGKQKHIVLIGKSITYDSGGLNLKPSRGGSLELMKMDMAGGAAVLGAMSALKRLGVKHRVTAYLPATENMLGDGAYKPGDVLKTYNGKTIEVGNTDAEGRLTLADALAYATAKDKPDELIDLATLTATDTALGPDYAAIFATKPQVEKKLKEAGERTGELLWPLPFPESYDEMTKSPVADFSNIVSGRAYTLSGPLLLRHFVDQKKSWVHLDIGGPAISESDRGYTKKGGSGFGTRLLLEYLSRN